MKITRIEVRAVAPEVQRFTWSFDLPEQYMTNTVVRLITDDGLEGVVGVSNYTAYGFDRYTSETMRHLAPVLIGRDPLERERIAFDLRPRVFPLSPGALAALDVALWDLAGHIETNRFINYSEQPAHQFPPTRAPLLWKMCLPTWT